VSENPSTIPLVNTLHERSAWYVAGTEGQPVAILLTLEEYDHYLDLLADEADSQDEELTTRLAQAAAQPGSAERISFRDYLRQRETTYAQVSG
jgi:PHD/YefM family antitoxin component YafN of YafNO toxin-antitoxin module